MKKISFNLFNLSFVLIAAFPLTGVKFSSYVVGIWILVSLFLVFKEKTYKNIFQEKKALILLTSYYLLNVFSFLIFRNNINEATKILETKALFILFPLFVFLTKDFFCKNIIKAVSYSFAISNVIIALLVWYEILDIGMFKLLKIDSYYNPIIRRVFSDITSIHSPYLGMLFSFSSMILIDQTFVKKTKNIIFKTLSILGVLLLLFSTLLFSARMAIIAFTISAVYYFLKKLPKRKVIYSLIGFISILFIVSFLNPIQRRIKEINEISFSIPKENMKSHQVNFRLAIYDSSIKVLKENWLLGVGLGNTQIALNNYLRKIKYNNYDDFNKVSYNTHNQYLNELVTHGIFGLIIFILPMICFFKIGTDMYKVFLIIIFLSLLTENLFERQIGVMFFTLFNALFYILQNFKKTNKLLNEGCISCRLVR